jgi:hypothetical protein
MNQTECFWPPCLRLRCLLVQGRAKMKLRLTSFLQLEWGYHWLFWSALSLKCLPTSWMSILENVTETQDADVCIIFCPKFLSDLYIITYIHGQELMKSVGRQAAHHNLWWCWWSDTLWETSHNVMTALIPHYLQSVIVEISLQSHRYVVNWQVLKSVCGAV